MVEVEEFIGLGRELRILFNVTATWKDRGLRYLLVLKGSSQLLLLYREVKPG